MKLGAHISIAGDLSKAAQRGHKIGCETMQIFTSNPKGWNFKVRNNEEINAFKDEIQKYNIGPVFGHAIYLTNLASNNPYIYTNSINSLVSGMVFAENIGLEGVITHIGSHGGTGTKEGIKQVVNAISQVLAIADGKSKVILETDDGSGNHLGGKFEEIGEILKQVKSSKVAVCLDTCHVFAAGYDVRNNNLDKALEEFDKYIGLNNLVVLHLNDSKGDLGSHLDRHEEIGKGLIGLESFKQIVNHPSLSSLPGIVETPDNKDTKNTEELSLDILKGLRNE